MGVIIVDKFKAIKWVENLKIDDKIRLKQNIHVRSKLDDLIVNNSSDSIFYNWYEEGEEFKVIGKIGNYYILEDSYCCFNLKVTEPQLYWYFRKNGIELVECFSCGNRLGVIGEINKGTVIKCPECGGAFICIDSNDYIKRWEDYNG